MTNIAKPVTAAVAAAATFLAPYAPAAQGPNLCANNGTVAVNNNAAMKFSGTVKTEDSTPVALLNVTDAKGNTQQCTLTMFQADAWHQNLDGLSALSKNQAPVTQKLILDGTRELNNIHEALKFYWQRVSEETNAQINQVMRDQVHAQTRQWMEAEAARREARKHSVKHVTKTIAQAPSLQPPAPAVVMSFGNGFSGIIKRDANAGYAPTEIDTKDGIVTGAYDVVANHLTINIPRGARISVAEKDFQDFTKAERQIFSGNLPISVKDNFPNSSLAAKQGLIRFLKKPERTQEVEREIRRVQTAINKGVAPQ